VQDLNDGALWTSAALERQPDLVLARHCDPAAVPGAILLADLG
jgi:hypothetical protein